MNAARLISTIAVVALVSASPLSVASVRAQPIDPAGHWEGKIHIPNRELNLTVDLAKNAGGTWIGSMTIPGTTTVDVPLATVAVDASAVRFTALLPGTTTFEGALSADAASLAGTASNKDGGVPFDLKRNGDASVKVPPPSSMLSGEFEGTWEGALPIGGQTLGIQLKLTRAPDGRAVGTLVSVDQNHTEIPVTTVTLEGAQLQLDARAVSGRYKGTLSASGEISGEWSQGPATAPLTFKRIVLKP
jgi:hypothetical protein